MGVQLPFWPLYLTGKGLSPAQVGQILAAGYLIKIVSNPLIGHRVDSTGDRRRAMIGLSAISILATLLFAVTDGFAPLLAVTLVSSASYTALMPLGDSLTLLASTRHGLAYGRIRLWGSISFILVAGLGGILLVDGPRSAILLTCLAGQIATFLAVIRLPSLKATRAAGPSASPAQLFRGGTFPLFLASASLLQVSHSIYYGFATLYWRAAGLDGGIIGALWAEGVIAEVALFAVGQSIIARIGPVKLLVAAGIGGLVRWTVLAATVDPAWLASVQLLHALTFGATHLGAMHFIHRAVPTELSARAQGLYSSVSAGVVPGIAMLGSGLLYQELGGLAFLPMAAAAAAGGLLSYRLLRRWRDPGPL